MRDFSPGTLLCTCLVKIKQLQINLSVGVCVCVCLCYKDHTAILQVSPTVYLATNISTEYGILTAKFSIQLVTLYYKT